MSDRISIEIRVKKEFNVVELENWFKTMSFFIPTDMSCKKLTKGKLQKYNEQKFYNNLELELGNKENNNIRIKDSENTVSFRVGHSYERFSSLSCVLEEDIFEKNKDSILSFVDDIMTSSKGVVAFACSLGDWFWQHNEDLEIYDLKGKSLDGIVTKKSDIFPDDEIVDIEFNPGHSHVIDGVWFGSCWRMWYGKEYFQYIPQEILSRFHNCYENKQLGDDCLRITLSESPWDYDQFENRQKQIDFRKSVSVGVDEIAHMLEDKNPFDDEIDPTIEVFEGEFEHNGIRLLKYYYDAEGNLTAKSRAEKAKIYELGEKGDLLRVEEKEIMNGSEI